MYAIVQKPESWAENPGFDLTAKKAFLAQDCWNGWGDDLKAIFTSADADLTPMQFYMLPVGITWVHRPGISLVGDAAHLMTMFGGAGANIALENGYELGEAILGKWRKFRWGKKGEESGFGGWRC
jgi:2-polyprenyl-6-methoxyphenol hydroxylase-like FAD-dependent oxidoreductase